MVESRKKGKKENSGNKKKYFKSKIPALILCNTFNKGLCVWKDVLVGCIWWSNYSDFPDEARLSRTRNAWTACYNWAYYAKHLSGYILGNSLTGKEENSGAPTGSLVGSLGWIRKFNSSIAGV